MMSIAIVPNEVSEAIHKALEKAYEGLIFTEEEYDQHYNSLLSYFDKTGNIPDFKLVKNDQK
jgi:hypothetical protein